MAIDYDKWNEEFGGQEALDALKNVKKNDYKEVPDGEYVCKLENLELAESKSGKPMVKGMFRITEGSCRNQCIFYNQVFTRGFPQHKTLEFLRDLQVFEDSEIDFDGDFADFDNLLLDITEESEGMQWMIEKSHDGEYTRIDVTYVL